MEMLEGADVEVLEDIEIIDENPEIFDEDYVDNVMDSVTTETLEFEEELDNNVAEASEIVEMPDIDYNQVYAEIEEELNQFDFDDLDIFKNEEHLNDLLDGFAQSKWERMDTLERKEVMDNLADYVAEAVGIEHTPDISFYYNPENGDYGEYNELDNKIKINEYCLDDSNEALDTVVHELWHSYQRQRASNPQTAKDYQYQYNFDHYIEPLKGPDGNYVNIINYEEQLVEVEARAFAAHFREKMRT
ncbi:hypothetical protein [Hungatella hathewayi]|uniref:Uncharacterized protein n=1 Tax=Hungatella hathewayi WAL-18680 TaxID=742737 RepID=G5IBI0_9FIRM|nr:hypothetical protein [Hungatella hathewayi]EHI61143.1 hypothetical protein HMPREF9473_00758 [ [Hungatella hathewayi WAL-18680]MBS4984242.1 hypothetical protein [Hungatella hathewayi]